MNRKKKGKRREEYQTSFFAHKSIPFVFLVLSFPVYAHFLLFCVLESLQKVFDSVAFVVCVETDEQLFKKERGT